MGILLAIVFVALTLAYEKFVPLSIKQTLNDMLRVIKGK